MQKIEMEFSMQEKCFDIKVSKSNKFLLVVCNHNFGGIMSLEKIKKGNIEYTKKFKNNKKLYDDLVSQGQHPRVLWVGCSDSRVVPEFIVNAKAGDLFVTRNIANIIPPEQANDSCTSSVLEYAVLHLNVEHIIICGHTGCGGITAVVGGTPKNTKIDEWLHHACNAKQTAEKFSGESKILVTIKENILLQAQNLLTFDYIEKRVNAKDIQIHKWLYDMSSGKISYYHDNLANWISLNK